MVGSIAEVFPKAKYQRCTVHFYRNVLAKVPKSKRSQVAAMLKAIHAMESREAASAKAGSVAAELEPMKLKEAAKVVPEAFAGTLTYCETPCEHWRRIRTRTTPSSGSTGKSGGAPASSTHSPMKSRPSCWWPRLKYAADSDWGSRRYLDVSLLKE